jgi:hypothetical protein
MNPKRIAFSILAPGAKCNFLAWINEINFFYQYVAITFAERLRRRLPLSGFPAASLSSGNLWRNAPCPQR